MESSSTGLGLVNNKEVKMPTLVNVSKKSPFILSFCLTDCSPSEGCNPDDSCRPDDSCNPDDKN